MNVCDPRTWGKIFRNHSLDGNYEQVLSLFLQKVRSPFGFTPDHTVLTDVLKASVALSAQKLGKSLHSSAIKLGHLSCLCVSKGLLNFYAKFRAFDDSEKLFSQIANRDAVVWNILLSGFSGSHKYDLEVMELFSRMYNTNDPKPSPITLAIILPICARLGNLKAGKSVHSYALKTGIESDTLVGNAFVSMYAKCGINCSDAYGAFSEIKDKDVVSWNAIIAGFSENGLKSEAYVLFREMLQGPIEPNYATIASILPVCASINSDTPNLLAREFHAYILRRPELHTSTYVLNALVSFYMRIGYIKEADSLFYSMASKDLVSWNAIIAGHALNKDWSASLQLFRELVSRQTLGFNSVTLLSIIPACAALQNLQLGKQIHGYVVVHHPALNHDLAVSNALISFYANCGDVDSAYNVFSMASSRDLISWNAMLDAFAENGYGLELASLLHQMLEEQYKPDAITMLLLVRFYGKISGLSKVREAHGYLFRAHLFLSDEKPALSTALLEAYGKCSKVDYAFHIFTRPHLFNGIIRKDIISWNTMISVFAENDCHDDAISLLCQLQDRGMKPDIASIMSILPICSRLASIDLLKQCHTYAVRASLEDVQLKGSLIDVYAKCGNIGYSRRLFQTSSHKDLVMFTAMIGGYAMNGMGEDALRLFSHMIQLGLKPDNVTINVIISACSHTGLSEEGLRIFHSMEKVHGFKPNMEQYACVVDLLGRRGQVRDAYNFVNKMPVEPSVKIWSTLLGACITYKETELGRIVAEKLLETEGRDIGSYVSVSNLYAADAKWDGVLEIRKQMKTEYLQKPAGCSWIEVDGRKSEFISGDCSHPDTGVIYNILGFLDQQIKEAWIVKC